MLERLRVHGFRTLFDTQIDFSTLTIMIGKNGAGKTTVLDAIQLIGKFARGGVERAFGPPPWSLGWQRSKGIGQVRSVDFELVVKTTSGNRYQYLLRLDEQKGDVRVEEERLTRLSDNSVIASYDFRHLSRSGTILRPDVASTESQEISEIASIFESCDSYELNPSSIERGVDPKITFVRRDGYGVPGFLASLKEDNSDTFAHLERRFQAFRPETEQIEVWSLGDELYWSLWDRGASRGIAAPHISWGDRQLLGLLCVLYSAKPGSTIAIEEIDRGFHPSRYLAVIELLSEAAYKGLDGAPPFQVVVTTHSSSFVNKLRDRLSEIRIVTRSSPSSSTVVRPLQQLAKDKLGTDTPDGPIGDIWEMGILDDVLQETVN